MHTEFIVPLSNLFPIIILPKFTKNASSNYLLGECIALWGKPNELSIQYRVYIFMQYVDS